MSSESLPQWVLSIRGGHPACIPQTVRSVSLDRGMFGAPSILRWTDDKGFVHTASWYETDDSRIPPLAPPCNEIPPFAQLQMELIQANAKVADSEQTIAELRRCLEGSRGMRSQAEEQLREAQRETAALHDELVDSEQTVIKLRKDLASTHVRLVDRENQIKQLRKSDGHLREQLRQEQFETAALHDELVDSEQTVIKLRNGNADLLQDIADGYVIPVKSDGGTVFWTLTPAGEKHAKTRLDDIGRANAKAMGAARKPISSLTIEYTCDFNEKRVTYSGTIRCAQHGMQLALRGLVEDSLTPQTRKLAGWEKATGPAYQLAMEMGINGSDGLKFKVEYHK